MLNFSNLSRFTIIFMIIVLLFSLPLTAAARNPNVENIGKPDNTEPTVKISSPTNGDIFKVGENIIFSGSANDTQIGDLTNKITWSSDIKGSLGRGGSVSTASLPAGTYTITAAAIDNKGLVGTAQINFTVTASAEVPAEVPAEEPVEEPVVNTAPVVSISSPVNSASFIKGASISFKATANDNQEGDLTSIIAWSSSVNGSIGTGGSVSTAGLSAGTHTITATATDSKGAYNTAQIIITVSASVTEGVPCNVLGLIPNDASKGLSNYNLLIAEAKKGTKIRVNGTYYLQAPYTNANEVNAGLFLTGDSAATSKLILNGGTFFNVKGEALIENISIESPTDRISYLIKMTAPFVNEITVRNNYVTGNIRLVSSTVPVGFNFASTPCYIKTLTIENNEFYDVYNSEGSRAIIYVNDTPVKSAYIRNNKVTNFSYLFYCNGITNGNSSGKYILENTNAIIENNIVRCTDDYDAVARNGGTAQTYLCFALIEGFNVECRGNTFEGIHLSDAPGTSVYDNYFSVTKLLYEGNTWKNNVNFTPGLTYVDIMKSKQGSNVNGAKTERIYRGNTYIVEPGYADKFGADRFLLRKEINTWQTDLDSIIIEDNYFDMYILSFGNGVQYFNDLYKFNRNTILMDTIEHSVNRQVFAYVKETKDGSGNFIPRNLIFTNNTITCDSRAFGQGTGTKEFYLIINITGSGDRTTVDFSNNNLKIPDFVFSPSSIATSSSSGTVINFNNNVINGSLAVR